MTRAFVVGAQAISASSKVRAFIAEHGEHTRLELMRAMPELSAAEVRAALHWLIDSDHLSGQLVGEGRVKVYELTAKGRAACAAHFNPGQVAQPRQPYSIGQYAGAELRTRVARAGAYDAFALPSVVAGQRVARTAQAGFTTAGALATSAAASLIGTLLLLAACAPDPEGTLALPKSQWICSDYQTVSFKPFLQECVTYRKLR